MNNLEEMEDSFDDLDVHALIERCKQKPRMAMKKMVREFSLENDDNDQRLSNLEKENIDLRTKLLQNHKDIHIIRDAVVNIKSQMDSRFPHPPKVDASSVPNNWESYRCFNTRWPWISLDLKTFCVKCGRCKQSEKHGDSHLSLGDNFQWFVNTHGACQDPKKKETTP